MTYELAQTKAWEQLCQLTKDPAIASDSRIHPVRFLADQYEVDLGNKTVFSTSCNVPAKEHAAILILHYLIKKLQLGVLPYPSGEWLNFRQLEGGGGYYPTFKKRTIDVVLRKYGARPEGLIEAGERLGGKRTKVGDVGVILEPFERVLVLVEIWKGSEEFKPDANIVFDKTISEIFCTEDTVVLTEFIARQL